MAGAVERVPGEERFRIGCDRALVGDVDGDGVAETASRDGDAAGSVAEGVVQQYVEDLGSGSAGDEDGGQIGVQAYCQLSSLLGKTSVPEPIGLGQCGLKGDGIDAQHVAGSGTRHLEKILDRVVQVAGSVGGLRERRAGIKPGLLGLAECLLQAELQAGERRTKLMGCISAESTFAFQQVGETVNHHVVGLC
jgi:hypothetical protein